MKGHERTQITKAQEDKRDRERRQYEQDLFEQREKLDFLRERYYTDSQTWSQKLKDIEMGLQQEAEARELLQEGQKRSADQLHDLLTQTNTVQTEKLESAFGAVSEKFGEERNEHNSLVRQTHDDLNQRLTELDDNHGAEFEKIAASFATVKKQLDSTMQQLRHESEHTNQAFNKKIEFVPFTCQ